MLLLLSLSSGRLVMNLKTASIAVLLALLAAACQPAPASQADGGKSPPPSLATFQTGEFAELDLSQDMAAPASAFVDATGAEHTFAEFKGKVVVFNVWAEWCAPCVEEMPTLAALQDHFGGTDGDSDVVVIPIAFGYPDARDSAKDRLARLVGDRLPFYYDSGFNVNADAKSGAFPSTIIYDRDGMEQARLMRPADWASEQAIALVQAVADGAS